MIFNKHNLSVLFILIITVHLSLSTPIPSVTSVKLFERDVLYSIVTFVSFNFLIGHLCNLPSMNMEAFFSLLLLSSINYISHK